MKNHHKLLTTLIMVCAVVIDASAQPFSDFATDLEGWTAYCESPCILTPGPQGWNGVNGNSLGCYKVTDNANGVWYYNSPAEFNIDLSTYYGGTLSFDLKQNGSAAAQFNDCDVMFVKSDGTRIVYDTPTNPLPANTWVSYTITLSEAGWKYTNLAGGAVTYTDFIDYITNFSVIKIRGDFSTSNSETTWFDNAKITLPIMLPVELVSLNGTITGEHTAQLNWQTVTEHNADYFEIEKSLDYGVSFEPIGHVIANGNTLSTSNYIFYDDNFKPDSYYRLKIVDQNQQYKFSNIITIHGNEEASLIGLYPNPANNSIEININSNKYQTLLISDSYGRAVTRLELSPSASENLILDVQSFSNGIYFLSLLGNTDVKSACFQVLH